MAWVSNIIFLLLGNDIGSFARKNFQLNITKNVLTKLGVHLAHALFYANLIHTVYLTDFHRQARFAYGESILSSSKFLNTPVASKFDARCKTVRNNHLATLN